MTIKAYEGIIKNGRVELKSDIPLPDRTRVYVIIPEAGVVGIARVPGPRFAQSEEAVDFEMEVAEEPGG